MSHARRFTVDEICGFFAIRRTDLSKIESRRYGAEEQRTLFAAMTPPPPTPGLRAGNLDAGEPGTLRHADPAVLRAGRAS